MFVKICYGPLQYLTVLDVKTVDFTSHLQSNHFFNKEKVQCFIETVSSENTPSDIYSLYIDKDYISLNIGCSFKGNTDAEIYLNTMNICRNDGEVINIAYTGTAYLCNEMGRTVDTFR